MKNIQSLSGGHGDVISALVGALTNVWADALAKAADQDAREAMLTGALDQMRAAATPVLEQFARAAVPADVVGYHVGRLAGGLLVEAVAAFDEPEGLGDAFGEGLSAYLEEARDGREAVA